MTNLYYRQRLGQGRITLTGGFLDVTDYVDVFALASPWTGFVNFAFSTGTTTVFLPNDATLGVAAGAMLSRNLYVTINEPKSGKSAISLGLMELLAGTIQRVGFFRPIARIA